MYPHWHLWDACFHLVSSVCSCRLPWIMPHSWTRSLIKLASIQASFMPFMSVQEPVFHFQGFLGCKTVGGALWYLSLPPLHAHLELFHCSCMVLRHDQLLRLPVAHPVGHPDLLASWGSNCESETQLSWFSNSLKLCIFENESSVSLKSKGFFSHFLLWYSFYELTDDTLKRLMGTKRLQENVS